MLEAETIMKREFEATLLRYKPLLKAVSNVKSGMYYFYRFFYFFRALFMFLGRLWRCGAEDSSPRSARSRTELWSEVRFEGTA